MKRILFIFSLLFSTFIWGQNKKVDSLQLSITSTKDEKNKVRAYLSLSTLSMETPSLAISYADSALKISEKIAFNSGILTAYYKLGMLYSNKGEFLIGQNYFMKSLMLAEKVGDTQKIGGCLNALGISYLDLGDYEKSQQYFIRALKIAEILKSNSGIANTNLSLGNIYENLGRTKDARNCFEKAYKLFCLEYDSSGTSIALNNIGNVLALEKKSDSALYYFFESEKLSRLTNDLLNLNLSLANISTIYQRQGKLNLAKKYQIEYMNICKAVEDKECQALGFNCIAEILVKTGNLILANKYCDSSIAISEEIHSLENLKSDYKLKSEILFKQKDFENSVIYYKKFTLIKDSLFNIESEKNINQLQTIYQTEKKEKEIELLNKNKDIQSVELAKQKTVIWSAVLGLLIVLVFSAFLYNRFRITNKQKKIIELQKTEVERQRDITGHQKNLIEEKQKEIIDSITYAKRIQDALLKDEEHVSLHLPEHFVLYKPKDIIAGDFYWSFEKAGYWYVAAADCTGHGVPGAMMSMLGMSFLNEIISAEKVLSTGEVLNHLRDKIVKEMRQTGKAGESKDGMDISLLRIDLQGFLNLEGLKAQWSGANNQLWYIQQNEMKEITADKQPIGYYPEQKNFTTHTINLKKSDTIYLMTDGYPDQFGGPKGKKFKYKQLEEKLLSLNDKSLEEQKEILSNSFEEWKGNLEQVDDVTIIGIRL